MVFAIVTATTGLGFLVFHWLSNLSRLPDLLGTARAQRVTYLVGLDKVHGDSAVRSLGGLLRVACWHTSNDERSTPHDHGARRCHPVTARLVTFSRLSDHTSNERTDRSKGEHMVRGWCFYPWAEWLVDAGFPQVEVDSWLQ